ncbi:MAG TPA: hypothetical protein VM571_00965 [Noviherbaspirillum sp.]|nr:hypothetical protein [Noviherbaspirillum sp.]
MAIQTTTVVTTYTTTIPDEKFPGRLPSHGDDCCEHDETDIGEGGGGYSHGGKNNIIDGLPLPKWMKDLIKDLLGHQPAPSNLPSSSDAAKSINDFQNKHNIGLLSSEQMKQMAETGYCKLPNGETIQVPPDVQAAAQKMMENNGSLFKKLESATDGNYDGKLGKGDYKEAIKDGTIGEPGTRDLPKACGLCSKDFLKFVMDGSISSNRPSEYGAAKTINDFQNKHNIGLLNVDQVKQMAEAGYCKLPNGETIQVPPEVQEAAQKMMENNGALFKKLESATDGKHDGMLGKGDFGEAIKDGTIAKGSLTETHRPKNDFGGVDIDALLKALGLSTEDGGNGLPSSSDAAKSIHDFQGKHNIGLLNVEQVKQMAESGYCKLPSGETIQVPPDVQAAAQKLMENNGELFKKLESAVNGNYDGKLSQADYKDAIKDGTIGQPGTQDLPKSGFGSADIDALLKALGLSKTDGANGLPSSSDAAKTVNDFQNKHDIGLLNVAQVKQMAETGYCKLPNGETIQVPPNVQAAAQKLMENNGELFKKLESATDGNYDGKLGKGDYKEAIKDGIIGEAAAAA